YPERIAYARPGNNAQFQLANGKYAQAHHKDSLAHDPWLAIANLDARQGLGKIFLAAPLNPRDLAPLVKQEEVIRWDTTDGELTASRDLRIGSIVLQSKPLPPPDERHLVAAICEAVKKEGEELLDFNEQVSQWQLRVLSLRKWRPQEGWPEVSTPTLLMTNYEWLRPHLAGVETPEDLRAINLLPILEKQLDAGKKARLEQLAPESIVLPDGAPLELQYLPQGAPPRLEVRLQDVLAWPDNPRIDAGEMAVELQLLRPDLTPLQLVADLKGFWADTYPSLQQELERQFPKVNWNR
ncbi:MAG: ATP-dependent helicase C-terminal domain-containing protein, partial [Adhaeribacter sp.]